MTIGEAMDSGDKSANKAMSAAMKYALIEVFAIPTIGDNDTENHTHEVAPQATQARQAPTKPATKPVPPFTEAEAEKAKEAIDAAFQRRGIVPSKAVNAVQKVLDDAGHEDLLHAGRAWAKHLIGSINAGNFDSLKTKPTKERADRCVNHHARRD